MRQGHSRTCATMLKMRLGNWIWRNGGRGEDLQLAYLLPWLEKPEASKGMPSEVGRWDKAMNWVRVAGKDLYNAVKKLSDNKGGHNR